MNSSEDTSIGLNNVALRNILRRRWPALLGAGLAVIAGLDVLQLLVLPQTFSAVVSIAVQQPSQALSGGLALLAGDSRKTKNISA